MAFSAQRMLMASAGNSIAPAFNVYATYGGLTGDVVNNTAITGQAASATGSLSFWANFNSFPKTITSWLGFATSYITYNSSTNVITVGLSNASSTTILSMQATKVLSTGVWYNFLISWDVTNSYPTAKLFNMYINNVNASPVDATDGPGGTIAYNGNGYEFFYGSSNSDFCVSEFWLSATQYIDFSVSGNRAAFYNAGSPVNLGNHGQTPTGSEPLIYWKGQYNNLATLGTYTGGLFLNGGTIVACSSIP